MIDNIDGARNMIASDPILTEVVRNKLDSIANEMQIKLIRSSFSPLVKEGFDAAASLFTVGGELLAQGMSIPGFSAVLIPIVSRVFEAFPIAESNEGDVFIMNDPYLGGTHMPDIAMIMPVFVEGRPVAVACAISHHQDVGGSVIGSMPTNATDIFQEGLRIPPVRLRSAGVINQTAMDIIRQNVRFPETLEGDLNAQYAACLIGADRLRALAARFGDDALMEFFEAILDRSEAMTQAALRRLAQGRYSYTEELDNDGIDLDRRVPVSVTVEIGEGNAHITFDGTSPQVAGPINCVPSTTQAAVYYAMRAVTDPSIPTNGGCFRPITVDFPERSLVNPQVPAPVNARTATAKRVALAMLGALRKARPGRVGADGAGYLLLMILGGVEADGRGFLIGTLTSGGSGAFPRSDGVDVIDTETTNCMNIPVEAFEMEAPIRIKRLELRSDSGGPGQWRGGLGLIGEYQVLEGEVTFTHRGERHFNPAQGTEGGLHGACARTVIKRIDGREEIVQSKAVVKLRKGDEVEFATAGGGGYGLPLERDPNLVARDVSDGKVSPTVAREVYKCPY